jgi:hypothetical protein
MVRNVGYALRLAIPIGPVRAYMYKQQLSCQSCVGRDHSA